MRVSRLVVRRPLWLLTLPLAATLLLAVACSDPTGPSTGAVLLSLSSTGLDVDPDGYHVSLDDASPRPAPANGELLFENVEPGLHQLRLSGAATNCTVEGGPVRDVTVEVRSTAVTAYQLSCVERVGAMTVSVVTTGADQDPDGYFVAIDGAAPRALAANGAISVGELREGSHVITLTGRATNCAASGGDTRNVQVSFGQTTTAAFVMTCVARIGEVRVTTVTTGTDMPNGYTVLVDGTNARLLTANGSETIAALAEGARVLTLASLPANCTVAGGDRREVAITFDAMSQVEYRVTCVALVGAMRVTTTTSGSELDPNGYRVDVMTDDYYYRVTVASRPIGTNASITIPALRPGTYHAVLADVAPNCTAASPSVTVTVAFDQSVDANFAVECVPAGTLHISTATTGADVGVGDYQIHIVGSGFNSFELLGLDESISLGGLRPGVYQVSIENLRPNCGPTDGPVTREIDVPSGGEISVAFAIRCLALGTLRVTNATTGTDHDPNGYVVGLPASGHPDLLLPAGGEVSWSGLAPGVHYLRLDGVAENCTLGGGAERQVVIPEGGSTTVALDVSCAPVTQLVFVSERDGNREIYLINSNGTGPTRLTTNAANDDAPAWSPDGRRIAFASERAAIGSSDIYIMNADGSGVVRRTSSGNNGSPAWSPDGRRIAFISWRDGRNQVYVMSAVDDGSPAIRLTNHGGNDFTPAWSPDGSRIAFASSRVAPTAVFTMNPDGTGVTQISRNAGTSADHWSPTWSPDGSMIAFSVQDCPYYCESRLDVMNADGSGARTLAQTVGSGSSWSPDGRTLSYLEYGVVGNQARLSLHYVRLDGSASGPIVVDGHSAAWRR